MYLRERESSVTTKLLELPAAYTPELHIHRLLGMFITLARSYTKEGRGYDGLHRENGAKLCTDHPQAKQA